MSAERIRAARDAGYEMGSCAAYALAAAGFEIPLDMFGMVADMNRRKYACGEQIPDSVLTILQQSGYSDWQRQSKILDEKRSLDEVETLLSQGCRIILKVDYGDGRNAHFVSVNETYDDGQTFLIGGDLRFIRSDEPYKVLSRNMLWYLMTRNTNYHGGKENLVYFKKLSSSGTDTEK